MMDNPAGDSSATKRLDSLLQQYDEVLSSGGDSDQLTVDVSDLNQTDVERFEQLRECVELLEVTRRKRDSQVSGHSEPGSFSGLSRPIEQLTQIGRFEIVGEIGRGGCGIVLRAHDPKLSRDVALKIPRPEVLGSQGLRDRFVREARAAGSVDHPNIVPIYEVGAEGPISFIAAAYIAGPTLAAWLNDRQDSIDAREAAAITATLADALEHAHARGVVHRDIKPGNILLQPQDPLDSIVSLVNYVPKIADFGLAKLRETTEVVTHTGAVIGTPLYMAPEQAEGRLDEIGPAADIYALGAVLFELLTGQPPLRGESDVDTLRRIVSDDPPLVRITRPRVPRDLEAICLKCLEKRPEHRYTTAGELAADLRRFLNGTPTSARPIGLSNRVWRWSRRRPAIAALLLVSSVLLVLLAGGTGLYNIRISHALKEAETERNRAEAQRTRAEYETLQARRLLYTADVRSAYDAWYSMNRTSALELLNRHIPNARQPDLRDFAWYWLWGQCHGEKHSFTGHTDEVFSVDFSPDGTNLATGSKDGTARIWDVSTGKQLHLLSGHTTEVTCVQYSPDGTRLATGSEDCQVILWDAQTGQSLFSLSGHEDHILSVAFSPEGQQLASGGRDNQVRVWNLNTKRHLQTLTPQVGVIRCLHYSPDGKSLAACDENGLIHRWGSTTWQSLPTLSQTDGPLFAIDFLEDSRHLVAAGRDSMVYYWDLHTGNCSTISETDRHRSWIRDSKLSPDGSLLANANQAGTVLLWSLRDDEATDPRLEATVQGHAGQVWSLAWSPDGKHLVTASADHSVKLWNIESLLGGGRYEPASGYIWDIGFSGNSKTIVSTHEGGTLRTWNTATHQILSEKPVPWVHNKTLLALDSSHDLAAVSGVDHTRVHVVEYVTGNEILRRDIRPSKVDAIACSPDGSTLAVVDELGGVITLEIPTGIELVSIRNDDRIGFASYSPDGRKLITCSRELRLWEAHTGELKWGHRHFSSDSRIARFSPDGQSIIAALGHHILVLIDALNGEIIGELQNDEGYTSSLAFTPDSQTLAVGTWDTNSVVLWDIRTRQKCCFLRTNLKHVSALAFSADGNRLVAAGETIGNYVPPHGSSQIVEWVLPRVRSDQ